MGVTIKDVAEAAGVSISTVSKVLNGHYSISEKTAQRVRGIMREMNYYPNANAQSFASGSITRSCCWQTLPPTPLFRTLICLRSFPVWRKRSANGDTGSSCGARMRPPPAALRRRSFPAAVPDAHCRSRGCHVPSSGRRADPAAISPHRSGRTGL